jgi:hypothetical protein
MRFVEASAGTVLAFEILVVVVFSSLVAMIGMAFRSTGVAVLTGILLAVWLGLISAGISTGTLAQLPQNGLPLFFGSVFVIWTVLALSSVGARVAATTPWSALVAFQAFRLPLEVILHRWAAQGTIPETMTWTGNNWDIVSGMLALACAPFARHKPVAWVFNIVGFALLLNVIRVAMLSSPIAFGWGVEPPLLLALHVPYAFIGPVCVGGALFAHIVLTRSLTDRGLHR